MYAQAIDDERLASLVAGARFLVQPVRSDAAGTAAMEALAAGVPVVASAVGALPEIVGPAGILVEPGDPGRLAAAMRAAWSDDGLVATFRAVAADRPAAQRSWADVARETRTIWSEAARPAPMLRRRRAAPFGPRQAASLPSEVRMVHLRRTSSCARQESGLRFRHMCGGAHF
ncbi:MAG: glycosyltransferase [Chloroflexota bacterium]